MTRTERESREGEDFRLLFVCTGNTCRSPLAEALARRELEELGWSRVEVASAGAAAASGAPASVGALRVAERQGLDLSGHRSTPLTAELVERADLILTMGPSHLLRVLEMGGEERVALLGAFADGRDGGEGPAVPDPFGGDDDVYEETCRVLEELVTRSIRRLQPLVAP